MGRRRTNWRNVFWFTVALDFAMGVLGNGVWSFLERRYFENPNACLTTREERSSIREPRRDISSNATDDHALDEWLFNRTELGVRRLWPPE